MDWMQSRFMTFRNIRTKSSDMNYIIILYIDHFSTVIELDTGTPDTSREIFSGDADDVTGNWL